jgi:hypothetical protein
MEIKSVLSYSLLVAHAVSPSLTLFHYRQAALALLGLGKK